MISDQEMDLWLWGLGFNHWVTNPYSKATTVPHELDYLRGIHNTPVLTKVASWLAQQVGCDIRLRTMWQDKHVYVKPVVGRVRELADIAVIVNKEHGDQVVSRTMWLLQAKVASAPNVAFTGPASKKEIELFEGTPPGPTPQFQVLSKKGGAALAPVFPAGAFNGPKHWSFLTLHRDPKVPVQDAMRERWKGSSTSPPVHGSFCGALIDVISGTRGMPVQLPGQPGDHWSSLHELLMSYAQGAPTTGHAKSATNPTGAIMQLSTLQQAVVLTRMQSAYPHERSGWMHKYARCRPWNGIPSVRSSGPFGRTTWEPLDRALSSEAFGDSAPPDVPHSTQPSEPMDPSPGVPLILFIDLACRRG